MFDIDRFSGYDEDNNLNNDGDASDEDYTEPVRGSGRPDLYGLYC